MTVSEHERWRIVWNRAIGDRRGSTVDRWDAIFGQLGISTASEAVCVPGSETVYMDAAAVRIALRQLEAVRNVLVHRSGNADSRLVEVGRDRYQVGRVRLTDDAVLDYGNAIHNYGAALAAAVDSDIEVI
jgi:hypothetical protein